MNIEPLSAPQTHVDAPPLRYFIADLHLDGSDSERSRNFRHFLEKLGEAVAHGPVELYIVGDLFELWYEFHLQLFEIYERDLHALEAAFKAGVKIYLFFGNRDFGYGNYALKRFGATILGDGQDITLTDHRRAWLEHGDLLCTADVRYLKFRKRIRSSPVRWLFRCMPWLLAKKMIASIRAKSVADKNRKTATAFDIDVIEARKRLEEHKCQVLICGHTHRPQAEDLGAGLLLIVLPAWCDKPAGYVDDNGRFLAFEM